MLTADLPDSTPLPANPNHPDAALIAACEDYLAADALDHHPDRPYREVDAHILDGTLSAEQAALWARTRAALDAAVATPALTTAGLRAKARIILTLPTEILHVGTMLSDIPETRLIFSLMDDIMRLTA